MNKFMCRKCGKVWYYDVKKCASCGSDVAEETPSEFEVIGSTEVLVSSPGNEAPYNVILLKDDSGNLHLKKVHEKHRIGSGYRESQEKIQRKKIGIVGTGVMGIGIAEVALQSGHSVILKSRSSEALGKARSEITKRVLKSSSEEQKNEIMNNLTTTTRFEDLGGADIVIESVVEDVDSKRRVFQELDKNCRRAVLASNSSSLSIDELASFTSKPQNVIGIHFFNPVPRMSLVEIVVGSRTSDETMCIAQEFSRSLGKNPVAVKNSPGFVVNRLLFAYLNEAAKALEEGVAKQEDIDKAIELGLNYPMGPFKLMDLIGLDVCLMIMDNLHEKFGDSYKPSEVIRQKVERGELGRKTGRGFYSYV